jgi:F420-non-reducing hydrogenase iron-sulfur subunit
MTFEPRILGFLCNWCSYAGADLAGVSRVQYPPNIRVIRVMCSGRVDPAFIFKAFEAGMDGVAVLGCHIGDCHYQTGNLQAEKKIELVRKVLEQVGLQPERLHLDWVSAAEGQRFGEVITDFTEKIRELGPISSIEGYAEKAGLGAGIVGTDRIRWLVGKKYELLEKGNVYGDEVDGKEYDDIILRNIDEEMTKEVICSVIDKEPLKVGDIARRLGWSKTKVFTYLTEMENDGRIEQVDFVDRSPRYLAGSEGGEC